MTSILEQANSFKDLGNRKFAENSFREAVAMYSKAINLAPDVATFYGNRSAAWFHLGEFAECANDCAAALARDPKLLKVQQRATKAYVQLADVVNAKASAHAALGIEPDDADSKQQLLLIEALAAQISDADTALNAGQFERARALFTQLERQLSASHTIAIKLARAELGVDNYSAALRLGLQVIKADPHNPDAYYVRAVALYRTENYDQAIKHFQEALRLDPDLPGARQALSTAKKLATALNDIQQQMFVRNFEQAIAVLSEAIELDPDNVPLLAKLVSQRAEAYLRLQQFDKAIDDSTRALRLFPEQASAFVMRSKALEAVGRLQEAYDDIKHVVERIEPSNEQHHERLQKLEFEIKKAKRKNYYSILGVMSVASALEIKDAYKQRALEWHPDKHSASEEARAKAEATFKDIQEANDVLSDPFKRELYDKGFDLEGIEQRVEYQKRRESAHGHGHGHGHSGSCTHDH
eukprot:TRINITY_DN11496_c0_g1_i1.p1 TRINITY_DN11496_c0_g1~~TRINITY_DN11496_c0_g1_i1.p1  ORF type:complete len:502 (-),score=167.73 TRINITY_DN11496_c0_g1_i1:49-1452(-)